MYNKFFLLDNVLVKTMKGLNNDLTLINPINKSMIKQSFNQDEALKLIKDYEEGEDMFQVQEYGNMLVFSDYDRSNLGLQLAIRYGFWYNKLEDFVFLEGRINKTFKPEGRLEKVFEKMLSKNNKYFVIVNHEWSEEINSLKYFENLKAKRNEK